VKRFAERRAGGAEGDFDAVQAAGEQRFGQRHGVVGFVNDRDADEPLLEPGIGVHKLMRMSFTNLAARVNRLLAFLVNRFCFASPRE
jgi:hypothetical protein